MESNQFSNTWGGGDVNLSAIVTSGMLDVYHCSSR